MIYYYYLTAILAGKQREGGSGKGIGGAKDANPFPKSGSSDTSKQVRQYCYTL